MIRTLAWKEYREHRTVWAALAALAVIVVGGMSVFLDLPGTHTAEHFGLIVFGACVVATTYGLVCGAMMLAGEAETGTLDFLDMLSGGRGDLWKTKVKVGVWLTLTQVAWIALLMSLFSWMLPVPESAGFIWVFLLAPMALEAFGWGLLFSGIYQSGLAAAGMTALVLCALWYVTFMPLPFWGVVAFVRPALACWAVRGSWRRFCRNDAIRLSKGVQSGHRLPLYWLAWRQVQGLVWILPLFTLLLGFLLAVSGVPGWPVVTLLAGCVCGIGVFAGEQGDGSYRFLGDQRLSPGRLWLAKVSAWFLLATASALLFLLALALLVLVHDSRELVAGLGPGGEWNRSAFREYVTPLIQEDWVQFHVFDSLPYPVMWLLYGFGIGQYCSLLVRKTAAALVLALMLSAAATTIWIPSLICGGLPAWQVMVPPIILLFATRLFQWRWISNQLEGRSRAALAGVGLLAAAWIGLCLWYRVVEIPDVGPPFNVQAFEASLPTPEQNEAGRLIRKAAAGLKELDARLTQEFGPPNHVTLKGGEGGPPGMGGFGADAGAPAGAPVPPPAAAPEGRPEPDELVELPEPAPPVPGLAPTTYLDQIWEVLRYGWPKGETKL